MKIRQVDGVWFSPTGNTRLAVSTLAGALGRELEAPVQWEDWTTPAGRQKETVRGPERLVVVGCPVYAGRLPNKLLPQLKRLLRGEGALAAAVVTFGNRSYGDALLELRELLETGGFRTLAAAALPARHAFSDRLAPGRPDGEDLAALEELGRGLARRIRTLDAPPEPVTLREEHPVGEYYRPLRQDGRPANFLKARPETDPGRCVRCGRCAALCPMGSISREDPAQVEGVCIKCQACVRGCPRKAKFWTDEDYLSHVAMLEEHYTGPARRELFW